LECRRHQYTHSARTPRTFGEIRDMRKALMNGQIDLPKAITENIKWREKEYTITCEYGDEGFLLREIIFACLASTLDVLDDMWVTRYRQAENQLRILYALIYEFEYNLKVMQIHFESLFENFVIMESDTHPHFRVNIANLILKSGEEPKFLPYIPRLDDYVQSAIELNKHLDDAQKLDKILLSESEFRWLCPMLRGFCNHLLNDFPMWVYNENYVYETIL
jgi:hypothetical protein